MSRKLDLMKTDELVNLFLNEEENTIKLLKKEKYKITKVITETKKRLDRNGRVIYIGAGTSGRLGLLDAVETTPTFSTNSFKGIIAGGDSAFIKAKEGAEDNIKSGISDLKKIKLKKNDVVIGISASGETPYTVSALQYAKKCRALTIAITSNSKSTMCKIALYNISPEIRNEIIDGSSRLQSGTAQKILLNMISSISMIKSGKVYGNLMIDVQPTNKKLVQRATRIISIVCKVPLNKAKTLFINADKSPKLAIVMFLRNCNIKKAESLLKKAKYDLRKIIS